MTNADDDDVSTILASVADITGGVKIMVNVGITGVFFDLNDPEFVTNITPFLSFSPSMVFLMN